MKAKLLLVIIMILLVAGWGSEFDYSELHPYLYDITQIDPHDSYFIVGDGTDWVAESGNTARTSLGLGTGDSPTFTGLTLSNNLLVNGGDIGITGDKDLLSMAANALTINGTLNCGAITQSGATLDNTYVSKALFDADTFGHAGAAFNWNNHSIMNINSVVATSVVAPNIIVSTQFKNRTDTNPGSQGNVQISVDGPLFPICGLCYSDTETHTTQVHAYRFGGTYASKSAVADNYETLRMVARGYDGARSYATAAIEFIIDGAVSTENVPQEISFQTGATTSRSERMRITPTGIIYMPDIYNNNIGAERAVLMNSDGQLGYDGSYLAHKKNIRDYEDTSWLYELTVRMFDRPDFNTVDEVGLIAEEVAAIEGIPPKLVSYKREKTPSVKDKGDGEVVIYNTYSKTTIPETVNKSQLIIPMLKEIQKLNARVTKLEQARIGQ